MKQRKKSRFLILELCILLLLSSFPVFASENIIPSKKTYDIEICDTGCVFFGNATPVDFKIGKKYFLTYTVESVAENTTGQSGMVVTSNPDQDYPYVSGTMLYEQESLLMKEGYTYFFRFEMTESGMQYIAAMANDDDNSYIQLPADFAGVEPSNGYFGIWTGEKGKLTASLSHVRCYDEKGTDLGIYSSTSRGVLVIEEGLLDFNEDLDHSYEFSLQDARTIAISNSRRTTSNVVYIEYTVKNLKAEGVTQSGVINTGVPQNNYPHGVSRGLLRYNYHANFDDCKMLTEGARYIVRFEKTENDFSVMIKRSIDGNVDYISCTGQDGEFTDGAYYALWFGEFCTLSADFVDVKCYDADGNNLAIQTNQGIGVIHHGNLEDYSPCDGIYYCADNNTFISLDEQCNASKWVDGEETPVSGTYYINTSTLYLTTGTSQEEFDYVFESFTDTDGQKYQRLRDVTVRFVSGSIGGEELGKVTVSEDDGYKLTPPEAPSKNGDVFEGWYLGDGTKYDFNKVVTESLTLYAKWKNGNGEYTESGFENDNSLSIVQIIGISASLIVVTAIVCVLVARKGGPNERKKRKQNS